MKKDEEETERHENTTENNQHRQPEGRQGDTTTKGPKAATRNTNDGTEKKGHQKKNGTEWRNDNDATTTKLKCAG